MSSVPEMRDDEANALLSPELQEAVGKMVDDFFVPENRELVKQLFLTKMREWGIDPAALERRIRIVHGAMDPRSLEPVMVWWHAEAIIKSLGPRDRGGIAQDGHFRTHIGTLLIDDG